MSRQDHRKYTAALEQLREQQKSIMAQKEGISSGDIALWFLAAFMALGLLLLAPKLGRHATFIVLIAMFSCLIHPVWQLPVVKRAQSMGRKIFLFSSFMVLAAVLIASFGVYVWPESKRAVIVTKIEVRPYQLGRAASVNVHFINRDSPDVQFNGFWQLWVWHDVMVPGGDPLEQRKIEDDNWADFIKATKDRSAREHVDLTLPMGTEKNLLEEVIFTDDDMRALISGEKSLYITGLIRDVDGDHVTPYCAIKTPHALAMVYCQGHN